MSSPQEKKGRKPGSKPTVVQLRKDLTEAQALLTEKDEELSTCREAMAAKRGRIVELEQENERLIVQVNVLEQTHAEVQDLTIEDNPTLKEVERLKQKLQKAEQVQLKLKKENQDLEDSLQKLKQSLEQPAAKKKNDVSIGKSTFRLELYPHQDRYRARLTHFQSEDHNTFDWTDKEAILDFINSHSPSLEIEKAVEKLEKVSPVTPELTEPMSATEKTIFAPQPAKFRSFDLISPRYERLKHILPHDQPCKAYITINLKDAMEAVEDLLEYKVTMYAQRLDGEPSISIPLCDEKKQIQWSDVIAVDLESIMFPAGLYRLETSVTFNFFGKGSVPVAVFQESGLVQVQ